MSDDSSDDNRNGRKKRQSGGRKRRKAGSGSDVSDDDSDASIRSSREGSESDSDAGESPREIQRKAAAKATSLANDTATRYNKLRHTIHHLKQHLFERQVKLPVVHLLPEQSADALLTKAKQSSPNDSLEWVKWLEAWQEEHYNSAEARRHLLLQLKADLRCMSRTLLKEKDPAVKQHGMGESKNGPPLLPEKEYVPSKEWNEAMLFGKSYEDLVKEKSERLEKIRFRRQRRKAREAVENAEWEKAASKVASGIQRLWRARVAQRRIQDLLDQVYEKVYDENTGGYYYYNKVTCTTSWDPPKLLHHEMKGVY